MNWPTQHTKFVDYPEGQAPFGATTMLRADHESVNDSRQASLSITAGGLAQRAWQESNWVDLAIGHEAADVFRGERVTKLESQVTEAMILRKTSLNGFGWYAIDEPLGGVAQNPQQADIVPYAAVKGIVLGKIDVSGSPRERLMKRLFYPDKVYAKVSDINVQPVYQGNYVGAALLYHMLGSFDSQRPTTTYVASANEGLIGALGELGYESTGQKTRTDLIEGAEYLETRLQAESVAVVRERLKAHMPWLLDTV